MTKKDPVIFLVGPTASGKSAVAIELALSVNAEIISCDAMQVYREAVIASDKPSAAMRGRVAHHLLDVVSVEEEFNVARYRQLALAAIDQIHARAKVPLIVGGSGMYMMALLDGLFEGGEGDTGLRAALDLHPTADLYEALQRVDPESAGKIAPQDKKRIVRAIEVYKLTGVAMSAQQKKRDGIWGGHDVRVFALDRPRADLYARVEARVDEMFAAGLVDEVRRLLAMRLSSTGRKIIGLSEVGGMLAGEYDEARAKYLMKLNTRHYVKRQMTWFGKDKRIEWVKVDDKEASIDIANKIVSVLQRPFGNSASST